MQINNRTIEKILKETISTNSNENTIKVVGVDNQNKYLQQLYEEEFKNKDYVYPKLDKNRYYDTRDYFFYISFAFIASESDLEYYSDRFEIKFAKDYLILVKSYSYYYISDFSEIREFREKYLKAHAKAKSEYLKKAKIKALKRNAILSTVKEIAKELKLNYRYEEQKYRILLFFKISKSKTLKISVPYKQFQEIVSEIKTITIEIMKLQEKNINFDIKSNAGSFSWYDYDE